ncbi:unnamed protein product [Leptidea sinapis]|uniref:Lysophospholipid acyltransferase 7 n=1 Tax=Leptidea sinapis TaxID=189913 RepID=A0A5E4PKJ6_9NEOP|nr:unnamed protein product [Leptidea sinapis]
MWAFVQKNKNDIIYLSLLLFSVLIGPYYRKLRTEEAKKWAGTILGITLIIIVSGYSAIHPICSALIGVIIIKVTTIRYCHVATFFFMFAYLFFFRFADKFGFRLSSGQTNLIQMIIVLRVIGVAFEMNGSWLAVVNPKKKGNEEINKINDRDEEFIELINPNLIDLSMEVWGCETVVTLRDSMKVWNKAVQYWVAMVKKKIIGFIMWFLRSHSESYQAAAFLLLTFDRIWIYYSSVYHYWYCVWLVFLVIGQGLYQLHKTNRPKKPRDTKNIAVSEKLK